MNSLCVHGLPLQDLVPGLLVVLVVDFNNVGHVIGSEVVVTPAPSTGEIMRPNEKTAGQPALTKAHSTLIHHADISRSSRGAIIFSPPDRFRCRVNSPQRVFIL